MLSGGKILLLPPRTVPNPTEVIDGLVEGLSLREPIEAELKKAAAFKVERKLPRS